MFQPLRYLYFSAYSMQSIEALPFLNFFVITPKSFELQFRVIRKDEQNDGQ